MGAAIYIVYSILCLAIWGFGVVGISNLDDRLYPKGNTQPLITQCQAEQQTREIIQESKPEYYPGFVLQKDPETGEEHPKGVAIADREKNSIRVGTERVTYETAFDTDGHIYFTNAKVTSYDWETIPIKDFYPHLTEPEISIKIKQLEERLEQFENKTKGGKKKK